MRQWIKYTLQSIGQNKCSAIASRVYLESAIKIALSLAKQLTQSESNCGSLPLSAAPDWANFVVVHVRRENISILDQKISAAECPFDSNRQNQMQDVAPPFASATTQDEFDQQLKLFLQNCDLDDEFQGTEAVNLVDGDRLTMGIDQQCEPFLESFEQQEPQCLVRGADDAAMNCQVQQDMNQGSNAQFASFPIGQLSWEARGTALKSPLAPRTSLPASSPDVNQTTHITASRDLQLQFIVESAEIKCPESETQGYFNRNNNESTESSQRLYYLGLLFFELFSGGEIPAHNLLALPYVEGAFTSLSTITLVKKEEEHGIVNSSKRRQGPSKSEKYLGLCQQSCEHLKLVGVTVPVCNLIFNMLEVVYGDMGGPECYTQISDVAADLQLMNDTPKFARGLDMNNVSLSSSLNKIAIPREEEVQSITSCYHRCLSGSVEIALIKGESGSGKSWLAHLVKERIEGEGGLFLTGKFDQMHQGKPFAALASAFDQYCDFLIGATNAGWVKTVVDALKDSLGRDALHLNLVQLIPKLGVVLDKPRCASPPDESCSYAVKRLHYLLCRFVDVISNNSTSLTVSKSEL
jgi:hypothetical protein